MDIRRRRTPVHYINDKGFITLYSFPLFVDEPGNDVVGVIGDV